MDIEQLYEKAAGFEPYDFQRRVAEEGLPELLQVPTGCGKTEAVGLGWLHRRRFHTSAAARSSTPHWLVVALPMRTLVEQTADRFAGWLERLELDSEIGVHKVQGGVGWSDRDWRLVPERDAVFIGTVDMLLSRALNRGYGDSRWNWPMSFGGFNNGTHWVFDEIQLMDVATPNTRQLQSFRDSLGTALPTASTWMSATVDDRLLQTVDWLNVGSRIALSNRDRNGLLSKRLEALRAVREVQLPTKQREKALAQKLADRHSPGTLTLAVFNTVDSAIKSWRELKKLAPDAEVVLLHSRFRPGDRAGHMQKILAQPGPEGRIVVSTQVLEAGIDLSARVLFTEAAPWPSIVQRAGRCNREGHFGNSELLWAEPLKAPPYDEQDVQAAVEALRLLEGQKVTVEQLQTQNVDTLKRITPIIRRKDLIELFDTTPDLSGNDIDVARFIRDNNDRTVRVAWREIVDGQPPDDPLRKHELCNVPIVKLSRWLKKSNAKNRAWFLDHLSRDRKRPWKRCAASDLRDGFEIALDTEQGGYTSDVGWNEKSKKPVEIIAVDDAPSSDAANSFNSDVQVGDDPASSASPNGSWYPLANHLLDVKSECEALLQSVETVGLTQGMREAIVTAGWLHDIGKASHIWQKAALGTADPEREPLLRTVRHTRRPATGNASDTSGGSSAMSWHPL